MNRFIVFLFPICLLRMSGFDNPIHKPFGTVQSTPVQKGLNFSSGGYVTSQSQSFNNPNRQQNAPRHHHGSNSFNNNSNDISDKNKVNYPFATHVSDTLLVTKLRQRVSALTNDRQNKSGDLPGPQPHTLTRSSVDYLAVDAYWVCEKSDGQRTMIYACSDGIFFIDRSFNFFQINQCGDLYASVFSPSIRGETLLDGEIIRNEAIPCSINHFEPGGVYTLFMFDAVMVFGESVADKTLYYRLQYLKNIRQSFFSLAKKQGLSAGTVPVVLETKQFVAGHKIGEVAKLIHFDEELEEWIYHNPEKNIKVQNDGLVLTPDQNNYMMQHSKNNTRVIYKLKWTGLQTIDFVILKNSMFNGHNPTTPNTIELYTVSSPMNGGRPSEVLFTKTKISPADLTKVQSWFQSSQMDSIIAECVYDPSVGYWRFKCHRKDKNRPNFITTAISSMEAMADNLTWQEVEEVLNVSHRTRGVISPPVDLSEIKSNSSFKSNQTRR